jgi:hypothetical protein
MNRLIWLECFLAFLEISFHGNYFYNGPQSDNVCLASG